MSEWQEKEIGDLAFSYAGGTPSRAKSEYFGGTIPWISSSEVNQSSITETTEKITEKGLKYSSAKWVPADSVLIAMYGATAGQVAYLKIRATTNQAVLALIPRDSGIDSRFLYYEVDFNRDKILYHAQGSGQPNLNKQIVDRTRLLIPNSPAVQRKIARILSTIDGQIEKTEAIIAKYQAVKQGMLQDLFARGIDVRTGQLRPRYEDAPDLYKESALGMIPKEWEVKKLKDVCSRIQDGTHFSPKTNPQGRFLYITSKNIRMGFLDLNNVDYVDVQEHEKIYRRCSTLFGDVLLTKDGANTGNVSLNTILEPISLLSSVAFLRGIPGVLSNNFLLQSLSGERMQTTMKDQMSGNAIPRITLSKINNITLGVPLINEQEDINKSLQAYDELLKTEQRTLSKLKLLKQGMMQDLLSGKVEVTA